MGQLSNAHHARQIRRKPSVTLPEGAVEGSEAKAMPIKHCNPVESSPSSIHANIHSRQRRDLGQNQCPPTDKNIFRNMSLMAKNQFIVVANAVASAMQCNIAIWPYSRSR
jgi:hypothetical protein